jgi:hypothetical protein
MLMFRIFSSYPKFNVANRTDRTEFFSWNDNKVWFMANAILLCGISTDFKYYISYNGYNNASIFIFCLSLKRTLPHFFATAPQLWSPYHLLDHYLGDDVATEILLYYAINQHTIVASSLSNKSKHIEALYYSQSILTKYGVTRDSIKGWGVSSDYTSDNIIWMLLYDNILKIQARIWYPKIMIWAYLSVILFTKRDNAWWRTVWCDTKPSYCGVSSD